MNFIMEVIHILYQVVIVPMLLMQLMMFWSFWNNIPLDIYMQLLSLITLLYMYMIFLFMSHCDWICKNMRSSHIQFFKSIKSVRNDR